MTNYTISELLSKVLKSGLITQSQAKRLGVIRSLFFLNRGRSQTARDLGVSLPFVDRWKKRWVDSQRERTAWFAATNLEQRTFTTDRDLLLDIVADAQRLGAPVKFDEATKNKIIAIALKKPSDQGVPIEKWSHELLATHLIEQGVVKSISSSTVSDFLKSARRKPPS